MRALIPVLAMTAGCSLADPDPQLTRFSSCAELDTYMTRMALDEARWEWAVGFDDVLQGSVAMGGLEDYSLANKASDSAGSFSETNLQEAGVDEADLAKTDGTWLYSVAGDQLMISRIWPVEAAREAARVPIDGVIEGLYLIDDHVVVLSTVWAWEGPRPRSGAGHVRSDDSTLVTVIDVTDRGEPEVIRETYTSGVLEASRRIGDRLFVVTYTDVQVGGGASRTWRDAKDAIEVADAVTWLPRRVDHLLRSDGGWSTDDASSCGCTDVFASSAEGGTFVTNVLSLDLSSPRSAFVGEAVVGRADTVYASPRALYVAYTETAEGAFATFDGALDTVIHRFDIDGQRQRPRYDATAKIVGVLPDQFALSEQDGVLRVATTDTQSWSSNVYTLESVDGDFRRLDVLRGLAPGEQLFSSRFVGNIGYLVTYVVDEDGLSLPDIPLGDPLFTLDLSDPGDIVPVGELVLDGWSDYIHPLDDDHLLTVGMDDDGDDWQVSISLFDVSDLANPVLADRAFPGSVSSEAQEEHHAFNWYAPLQTLALPGVDRSGRSSLDLIEATPEGLSVIGKLHPRSPDDACHPVRRSVFLEDQVWAVSSGGLTASYADAPGVVIADVRFPGIEGCDGWSDQGW